MTYRDECEHGHLRRKCNECDLAAEIRDLTHFILGAGYRRCDIPACNCHSWHGGHANERLRELSEELDTQGVTILEAVRKLKQRVEDLEARIVDERARITRLLAPDAEREFMALWVEENKENARLRKRVEELENELRAEIASLSRLRRRIDGRT